MILNQRSNANTLSKPVPASLHDCGTCAGQMFSRWFLSGLHCEPFTASVGSAGESSAAPGWKHSLPGQWDTKPPAACTQKVNWSLWQLLRRGILSINRGLQIIFPLKGTLHVQMSYLLLLWCWLASSGVIANCFRAALSTRNATSSLVICIDTRVLSNLSMQCLSESLAIISLSKFKVFTETIQHRKCLDKAQFGVLLSIKFICLDKAWRLI